MIRFVKDFETVVKHNLYLVLYSLEQYPSYSEHGYDCPIPKGVDPENPPEDEELKELIRGEIRSSWNNYTSLIERYNHAWVRLLDLGLSNTAKEIYGYEPDIDLLIVPTEYGPGAGPRNGEIDSKLLVYLFSERAIRYRGSPEVSLLHEVVSHAWSMEMRKNTPISEEFSEQHPVKERVMDLLTREFGVRLGLGSYSDFVIQDVIQERRIEVANKVDPYFYNDPKDPSKGLKHPRDIKTFFKEVIDNL